MTADQQVDVVDGFAHGVVGADLHVFGNGMPLYLLTTWRRPASPPDPWLCEMPSRLLNARYRVVPFTGRSAELADLHRWCTGAEALSVRWLHGPGGQGKTRLADEAAARAAADGWQVVTVTHGPGQVHPPPGSQDLSADHVAGVLLVVDYADRWPVTHLATLLRNRLLHRPGRPARVLLVGRTGASFGALAAALGPVQADLSAQRLAPLDGVDTLRRAMFETARDEFLIRYGRLPTATAPGRSSTEPPTPGPPPGARPAGERPPGLAPPALLADPEMGLTLAVHMAALVVVDAHRHGRRPPDDLAGLTVYLLDREHRHWADRFDTDSTTTPPDLLNRAVFIASLSGAQPADGAVALLRRLLPDYADAERVATDHAACYPPDVDGTLCRPLYPDRLAEDFVALTLAGHPADYPPARWAGPALAELLAPDTDGGPPPWLSRTVTTLAAAHLRWPHVGPRHLYPFLSANPRRAVEAGGDSLATLAAADDVDLALLEAVTPHLPDHRHLDLDVAALAVLRRLADGRLAAAPDPTARANVHEDLGYRLNITGHREDACAEMSLAAALYRTVANDDAGRADLAHALGNLAHTQLELGRRTPALVSIEESRDIYQRLANERPDEYEPDLAYTLNSLGTVLAALGRYDDAVAACFGSAAIYRRLVASEPDTHDEGLASALGNRGLWLHRLGEYEPALAVVREAREIYERLADREPDAYRQEVAAALANEAMQLDELRRYPEAVVVSSAAVDAYRTLTRTRAASYEQFLATALSSLSGPLSKLGRYAEALAASTEAVAIRRRLAEARPAAFEADLAIALNNRTTDLLAVSDPDAALVAVDEAIAIRRRLAADDGTTYRPFLASALNNRGEVLLAMDRAGDAADMYAQASDIFRELAADRPAAHAANAVASLVGLARARLGTDSPVEALVAAEEATAVGRALAGADGTYIADLAGCLTTTAIALAALERSDEARAAVTEALEHFGSLAEDVQVRPRVAADLAAARGLHADLTAGDA